ncbi:UDP-N-acetylmuramate--L-alanine ligase [candidate division KSB1 bacterium]|nr:MAG: UDP-N-acetylmuramate--L-alanine ligase [candidate division KSB1 bacterium]
MSGIAEVLINLGFTVTGSDLQLTDITNRLEKLGASIKKGHNSENVIGSEVVVYSSAVKPDNVELITAKKLNIPTIRRAEMLGELMRMKYGIAVAGTHGKTTTTSLIGLLLTEGGYDPTIIVGGKLKSFKSGGKLGYGDYLVAEADEFDRSFLNLTPTIAVITTIESEHLDCYKNLEEIKDAFVEFSNKVPFYGSVIACLDERSVQDILPRIEKRLITFGLTTQADYRANSFKFDNFTTKFKVFKKGKFIGNATLKVPGEHNIKNALAAIAVSEEMEIPFVKIKNVLKKFTGVYRRFELKGIVNDIMVIDDYAHHPTEIKASLKGAKYGWKRKIITVFQPHLYTRTRDFCEEFGRAFFHSDVLVVTDIYPAREAPIENVTGELIADWAKKFGHKNVIYVRDKNEIPEFLLSIVKPGDMIITMGAGDIWKTGEKFIELLKIKFVDEK